MNLDLDHPQNPYQSYLVQASAGSGKTYQLCKRFLYLIASGAKPNQILTITFTVKAATEMRSRIIEEATNLLLSQSQQSEFDESLHFFYQDFRSKTSQEWTPFKPMSAVETAKQVLASTQSLRILTIDAIFKDWVSKFPWEASQGKRNLGIANHFEMMEAWESSQLDRSAWNDLMTDDEGRLTMQMAWQQLKTIEPEKGILGLEQRVFELFRHQSFLWKRDELGQAGFVPLPQQQKLTDQEPSWQDIVKSIEEPLRSIAEQCTKKDLYLAAIMNSDIQALKDSKLITKQYKISGAIVRGKKRDGLVGEISRVEEALVEFNSYLQSKCLNKIGQFLYQLYQLWVDKRQIRKRSMKKIEFSDLSMGCFRLFNNMDSVGATWLIQKNIRHLVIDEFQDTSLLQWEIFKSLSQELLSGLSQNQDEGLVATTFFVGDGKQSIYGFREADPVVLDLAQTSLGPFGQKEISLNQSYRSSQIVLDYVNELFTKHYLESFPSHQSAKHSDGSYFVANVGSIQVHDLFEDTQNESAVEQEAKFVAGQLRQMIDQGQNYPVFERGKKTFRPLKAADCCILYRSSKHVAIFEKALRDHQVPYRREEQKSFFLRTEILDLLSLLQAIVYPADYVSFLTLLRSPILNIDDAQLVEVLHQLVEAGESSGLALRRKAFERFPRQLELFKNLSEHSGALMPHELVCTVLFEWNILPRYEALFKGNEGEIAKKNLLKFIEICIQLEDEGHGGLGACLEQLMLMKERDEQGSESAESDVVTLMTIHKAKGLEFPCISLIGTGEDWFKLDRCWLKDKHGVSYLGVASQQPKDSLSFKKKINSQKATLYQESIRLLYVALTRSSQYLLLTGSKVRSNFEDAFFPGLLDSIKNLGGLYNEDNKTWSLTQIPKVSLSGATEDRRKPFDEGFEVITRESLLPSQALVVHPHEHGLDVQESKPSFDAYPTVLARGIGVYIHSALEAFVCKQEFDHELVWKQHVENQFLARRLLWSQTKWQECKSIVDLDIDRSLMAASWRQLFDDAQHYDSEVPLVHYNKGEFIRGSMDLYIVKQNRVLIIDYKSMALPLQELVVDSVDHLNLIKGICRQRGIERQLKYYAQAVAKWHPDKKVETYVWLTKYQQLLPISQ